MATFGKTRTAADYICRHMSSDREHGEHERTCRGRDAERTPA
jgi:hypothetical protein